MSFIQRIKNNMTDPRNTQGLRSKVTVDLRDLSELIHRFETLDSERRAFHIHDPDDLYAAIKSNITAAYNRSGNDAVSVMTLAMEVVTDLRRQELKER